MAASTNEGSVQLTGADDAVLNKWTLTTADHTGVGIRSGGYAARSIQFAGTWGAATAKIEGSNDSTNGVDGVWFALSDPQGTEISKTADGFEQVQESARYVRPRLTTVGVGAAVVASLFAT